MGLKQVLLQTAWKWYALNFPVSATKMLYKKVLGVFPNLKNPTRFTEKLQYLKLFQYSHDERIPLCIDKYQVREYVASRGCGEILNPLIAHWDDVNSIEWEKLPDQFALKCTHGCGFNIICANKSNLDINKTKTQLSEWMNTTYGVDGVELIYNSVKPSIICEQYIRSCNGSAPVNYKFFCSFGEAKFIYVETEKEDGTTFIDYFSPDWEWIPVKNRSHPNRKEAYRPERLNDMIRYCKLLGEPFPITRIDFYYEDDRIIFGELTFLPSGGYCCFEPSSYDEHFGKMFPLNKT